MPDATPDLASITGAAERLRDDVAHYFDDTNTHWQDTRTVAQAVPALVAEIGRLRAVTATLREVMNDDIEDQADALLDERGLRSTDAQQVEQSGPVYTGSEDADSDPKDWAGAPVIATTWVTDDQEPDLPPECRGGADNHHHWVPGASSCVCGAIAWPDRPAGMNISTEL